MSKRVWTINVVVNTRALSEYATKEGSGTWENPIGSSKYWYDDVRMVATSNQAGEKVHIGNGDSFNLNVKEDDKIRWVVSEINPLVTTYRSVCMYGFDKVSNWDGNLGDPHAEHGQNAFMRVKSGFDWPKEPSGKYVKGDIASISVPATTVLHGVSKEVKVKYLMKLLLLNYDNISDPRVEAYIKIDPTITIKKS